MFKHRIIAVLNQKGGVGKTTVTANLAHGLSLKGLNVLSIDLDPQAQLTTSLGVDNGEVNGLDGVLLSGQAISDVIIPARENLYLVPAGYGLSDIEHITEGGASRGMLLRNALTEEASNYDYVLIDCPPSSGLLVVNAIFASNEVLIPMTGDFLALQGLSHLMATLGNFEKALGSDIKQMIVLSKFQPRRCLSQEVKNKLIQYFPGKLLQTEVSESVALAESPSFGKTIFEYKPKSKSALEYKELVDDVVYMRVH